MSFIIFDDTKVVYDNPTLNFSSASATWVIADTETTTALYAGTYILDYTAKGGSDKTNRVVEFRILVNGIVIDHWLNESNDINDRYPLTGVSKVLNLLEGTQTVSIEVMVNSPATVYVDSFRFSLKKIN